MLREDDDDTQRDHGRTVSPPRGEYREEQRVVNTAASLQLLSADGLEKKREELDYEFHSSRRLPFNFSL